MIVIFVIITITCIFCAYLYVDYAAAVVFIVVALHSPFLSCCVVPRRGHPQ